MKKGALLLLYFTIAVSANAQIISTFAGNGTPGDTGDGGPATAASLNQPFACAFDSHGNFYFTEVEGVVIRKINTAGTISTFAGGGSSLGDGGPATAAQFSDPTGIAIDASDNVYIADLTDNRIRKIDATTDIITTIAGNGTSGYGGDNGLASASILNNPNNVCIDRSGNVYILDGSYRIRKINSAGIITTVAGNGISGYDGDGGMATSAEIQATIGICTDALGDLFFTEALDNHVRKVNTLGIITSIAGNGGASGDSGDGGPATAAGIYPYDITFDRWGNLYISCKSANNVRKVDAYGIIHTVAGNGTAAYAGDGGQATAAELYTPIGVATDTCGNLFIADRDDNHIRKVAINPSCINLAVDNVESKQSINIYPNPAYEILNIDNLSTQATYRLLSVVGVMVQHGTLKEGSNTISIQAIADGMYMIEIVDGQGERTVKKIIKQ